MPAKREDTPAAPHIEKRKVTMRSVGLTPDGDTATHEAVDYVPVDILDAYVADARSRWQFVDVGTDHDHGPGGAAGRTVVPAHLDHPLAGAVLHPGTEG